MQLVDVRLPGGDRVGVVEADSVGDRLPEPVGIGLAEDLRRLALGRIGGDRPVDLPLVLSAELPQHRVDRAGLADALLVEVGEQLRVGVAGDHDQGAAVEGLCAGL